MLKQRDDLLQMLLKLCDHVVHDLNDLPAVLLLFLGETVFKDAERLRQHEQNRRKRHEQKRQIDFLFDRTVFPSAHRLLQRDAPAAPLKIDIKNVSLNNFLNFSRQDAKAVVQRFLASLRLGGKSKNL